MDFYLRPRAAWEEERYAHEKEKKPAAPDGGLLVPAGGGPPCPAGPLAGAAARIYINFCDPWPRSNQKKRRLTHGNFLQLYRRVLPLGGEIHFKSDNDKLFEWSLEEIPLFGFRLSQVTRDLHAGGPVGVMTDYEAKFYQQGVTINRCVATMVPWEAPAEAEGEEA